ncbi:hypothetical protein AB833_19240 [Chromatiales bacterium (ex Bugula neritina AB1)]|nr:hypothetical protein AB833_19240 [Chromatiales bacterium (ex Bugula neritina AB1)]
MTEQKLNSSEIPGPLLDQCWLRPTQRVGTAQAAVEICVSYPPLDDLSIFTITEMATYRV